MQQNLEERQRRAQVEKQARETASMEAEKQHKIQLAAHAATDAAAAMAAEVVAQKAEVEQEAVRLEKLRLLHVLQNKVEEQLRIATEQSAKQ